MSSVTAVKTMLAWGLAEESNQMLGKGVELESHLPGGLSCQVVLVNLIDQEDPVKRDKYYSQSHKKLVFVTAVLKDPGNNH